MYKTSELKTMLLVSVKTVAEKSWEELTKIQKEIWITKYHNRFSTQEKLNITASIAYESILEDSDFNDVIEEVAVPSFKDVYYKYAPTIPEFCKVGCFSFGLYDEKYNLEINTISHDNEKEILEDLIKLLEHYEDYSLVGFGNSTFDIPIILTRIIINKLHDYYPKHLRLKNTKPWNAKYIDFQNDWKGLNWGVISLSSVCSALNIAPPETPNFGHKVEISQLVSYSESWIKALGECIYASSSKKCNF